MYQDGSIRLDCVAVGEWNLHTDAVYLPPFPKQHPLISASCTLQARCKMNKSRYDHSPTASSRNDEFFFNKDLFIYLFYLTIVCLINA
ncbi:unnamed protein product [Trichobilharzia regenti]|nr:unnamed protein product [Trichobilharzia regenti]